MNACVALPLPFHCLFLGGSPPFCMARLQACVAKMSRHGGGGWFHNGYGGGGGSGGGSEAHMGPIPLQGGGTLTAEDRARILSATGCSAVVRFRQQWGQRCLSSSGPAERLSEARRLWDEAIRAQGEEGGRRDNAAIEGLRQENIAIKARVTALEYQNGQLWAAARCAMQAAKETKDALETLQSNMETKKKKHKKKHDKGEKIRAEGKQVTTTEDEVPMKQEQQSSDDEKPQVSSAMDEKAESPTSTRQLSLDAMRLRLQRYVWMWYWRHRISSEGSDVLESLGALMSKVNDALGYWK